MIISHPSRGLRQSIATRLNRSSGPILAPVVIEGESVPTTPVEEFSLQVDADSGDRIIFAFETLSSASTEGAALLEIRALTSNGTRVAIPQWGYQSNRVQEFQYLAPAEANEIALTVFSVPIPPQVVKLELIGRKWKKNISTAIVGEPVINSEKKGAWEFKTDTGANLEFPATKYQGLFELDVDAQTIEVKVNHIARDNKSSGPLAIKFLDASQEELLPSGQLAQHALHGPIVVLSGDPGELTTTLIELSVPREARYLSIQGLDWSSKTANIVGNVELKTLESKGTSIRDFIAAIPHKDRLIVVDTTAPPMGHPTLGLRPNNLSLAALKRSQWVIFLPFSSLQEYPAHPQDRLYQVPRADIDQLWDAIREFRRGTNDIYVCSSFPSFEAITAAYDLRRLGWTVIYEVRDDMEEFNRVGYSKWYRPILEQKMLGLADKVVSVSTALDQKMTIMQPRLGQHTVIPNGVRQSVINDGAPLRSVEAATRREHSRVVGYVGHLTESWFDWPLLLAVANVLPDVEFEIVGHGMPSDLSLPSNVKCLGPKTHEELAPIVADWKVGLIPFKDIPLTHSVDPNKIYEYFAWGLRCVTVQMGAVDTYPWTKVYYDLESFIDSIHWGINTPVTTADLRELEEFVGTMSWDARMEEMLNFMETPNK